jgi:hypothetical protein
MAQEVSEIRKTLANALQPVINKLNAVEPEYEMWDEEFGSESRHGTDEDLKKIRKDYEESPYNFKQFTLHNRSLEGVKTKLLTPTAPTPKLATRITRYKKKIRE